MPLRGRDLWDWNGEASERVYFTWGALLFFIKYNLDRLIAWQYFDRPWYPWYYIAPFQTGQFSWERDTAIGAALLAISIPFAFAGVVLTLRRLRSLQWPLWLVALFFVPFLNLLFFTLLSAIPGPRDRPPMVSGFPTEPWMRW